MVLGILFIEGMNLLFENESHLLSNLLAEENESNTHYISFKTIFNPIFYHKITKTTHDIRNLHYGYFDSTCN